VEVVRVGVGRDLAAFRGSLRDWEPDVVLNLFEGFGDDPESECQFASILEEIGVPFTGSSADTLWRAGRKDIAKQVFAKAGLPTPAWMVVEKLPIGKVSLQWPVIVKPAFRDASVGIHQSSVVTRRDMLEERIADAFVNYGRPVLIEEFIEGREISAAVFDCPELVVLPLVENVFARNNGRWAIDSYDAKWQPGSRDYLASSLNCPAELMPGLAEQVTTVARSAYRALGCRGFVTIDFRVRDNMPYLLEVNPNADMKPSTCLTQLLHLAGIEYDKFLLQMIRAAKARQIANA
jgi:D-alanine-D-alanine ligase